ncbi:proteoglycan 4-like [Patiria miniata]|uniref:C2H2-type domain-containing protein n=1 Tax=Patiria miniata TaxID=46514 RepID=A0A914AHJ5_PATMI|nr:proteoglycan 4-like [Patiria miniata]
MRVSCVFCRAIFRTWKDLARHTEEVHRDRRRQVRCSICQFQTTSEDELRRHCRRMHESDRHDRRRVIRPYGGRNRYTASRRPDMPEERRPEGSRPRENRKESEKETRKVQTPEHPAPTTTAPSTPPQQLVDESFLTIHPSPNAMSQLDLESGPTLTTAELMSLMGSLCTPNPPSSMSIRSSPKKVHSPLPPDQPVDVPATPASPMRKWLDEIDETINQLLPPPPPAPDEEPADTAAPAPTPTPPVATTTRPPTPSPIPAAEPEAKEPHSLPANDPRFARSRRSVAPRTTAGAEVERMRQQARTDPMAIRSRKDVLHPFDFGVTVRMVTESATFPDGRAFSTSYTEYNLPSMPTAGPRLWTTQEEHEP